MENTNINQAVKCPLCRNIAPIMHYGKEYIAVCFTCRKVVFRSKNMLSALDEVKNNYTDK